MGGGTCLGERVRERVKVAVVVVEGEEDEGEVIERMV